MNERLYASSASTEAGLMGLWLVVSPLALGFDGAPKAALTAVVGGILIAVIGLRRSRHPGDGAVLSWINAAIGLFVLASPWLFGFTRLGLAAVNHVVFGAWTAWFSIQSALASRPARTPLSVA